MKSPGRPRGKYKVPIDPEVVLKAIKSNPGLAVNGLSRLVPHWNKKVKEMVDILLEQGKIYGIPLRGMRYYDIALKSRKAADIATPKPNMFDPFGKPPVYEEIA